MGPKREAAPPSEPGEGHTPPPFRLYANLGKLDYVTRGAGRDLIIVGRYGAREICVTVPGSEVADLAARLGRPMAKREAGQPSEPRQLPIPGLDEDGH